MADPTHEIGNINDQYWLLRAEPIPPSEEGPPDEGEITIYVAHIAAPKPPPGSTGGAAAAANEAAADAANNDSNGGAAAAAPAALPAAGVGGGFIPAGGVSPPETVTPFGDPFMLRIRVDETVGEVKARIQEKLGVAPAEFEGWRAAYVTIRGPPVQYLAGEQGSKGWWWWWWWSRKQREEEGDRGWGQLESAEGMCVWGGASAAGKQEREAMRGQMGGVGAKLLWDLLAACADLFSERVPEEGPVTEYVCASSKQVL